MAIVRHPSNLPADLPAAVEAAATPLAMLWLQSYAVTTHRVSVSQLRALLIVARHGTTNLTTLAAELGAILSSASRLLDRLVAAGLVDRTQGQGDRREIAASLTRDGKRLLEQIQRERAAALRDILDRMPEAERAVLLSGLESFQAAAGQVSAPVQRASGDHADSHPA